MDRMPDYGSEDGGSSPPGGTKKMRMKTRILRKVNAHVRIVEDGGSFVVQKRVLLGLRKGMSEWETLNMFSRYDKAVDRKNMYIVMILMRDLGYRREFVKRRTDRKKQKGLI